MNSKNDVVSSINIVSIERFIESARDAGYKSLSAALAELIDNSLEAGAKNITIDITKSTSGEVTVVTQDDGCGMEPAVLQTALQFGGTTRFNSRSDSGRFGMGLTNSSISQTRRVEVITWQNPKRVCRSYLDVDEIASGSLKSIPTPQPVRPFRPASHSGTIVVWTKCDRIEFRNEKAFLARIRKTLGRLFRKSIWEGRNIVVSGEKLESVDPTFVRSTEEDKAVPYGSELEYIITVPSGDGETSVVKIQFVELPILKWHSLTTEQKKLRGITKGAGVSVLRAGREIDYGWFFMGSKRKENYDDWWRCEVCFEPQLDELFGVANTKQGIRPNETLNRILCPDLTAIAHTLNRRVRASFASVRTKLSRTAGEITAARRDHLLEPPKREFQVNKNRSRYGLNSEHNMRSGQKSLIRGLSYRFETKKMHGGSFFVPVLAENEIIVLLNENHPFFESIHPASVRLLGQSNNQTHRTLELMLLAAARAECSVYSLDEKCIIKSLREEWGKVLATFLE